LENWAKEGRVGVMKDMGESRGEDIGDDAPTDFSVTGVGAGRDGIKDDLGDMGDEILSIGIGRDIVGRASSNLRSCRRSPKK
jgi:hypothetical protein